MGVKVELGVEVLGLTAEVGDASAVGEAIGVGVNVGVTSTLSGT